jgi:hypothetical protein
LDIKTGARVFQPVARTGMSVLLSLPIT